jgi:putative transposase
VKKSRFTDRQIIAVLKQAESGSPIPELCRQHVIISTATFYKWRSKFGGMDVSLMDHRRAQVVLTGNCLEAAYAGQIVLDDGELEFIRIPAHEKTQKLVFNFWGAVHYAGILVPVSPFLACRLPTRYRKAKEAQSEQSERCRFWHRGGINASGRHSACSSVQRDVG